MEEIESKIEEYISEGYKKDIVGNNEVVFSRFWIHNYPSDGWEQNLSNEQNPPRIVAPQGLIKSPYGEYDNWSELDGIHYSFNVLKSQNLSSEMRGIVDILSRLSIKYEDDDAINSEIKFRFKKLRISFFECLYSRQFRLYNLDLYNNVARQMIDNIKDVELITRQNSRAVLFRTFDSIGFEAHNKDDAENILNIVNQGIKFKMHMKYYSRMVHFVNYLAYKSEDGFKFTKKLNYNSEIPQMEEIKEKISLLLLDKKYKDAYDLAMKTPMLPDPKRLKKKYRFRKSYVNILTDNFENIRKLVQRRI